MCGHKFNQQQQTYLLFEGGMYQLLNKSIQNVDYGYMYDEKPLFINVKSEVEAKLVMRIVLESVTLKEAITKISRQGIYTYISGLQAGDILFDGIMKKLSLLRDTYNYAMCEILPLLLNKPDTIYGYINNCRISMICEYYLTYRDGTGYEPLYYDEIISIIKVGKNTYKVSIPTKNLTLEVKKTNTIDTSTHIFQPYPLKVYNL